MTLNSKNLLYGAILTASFLFVSISFYTYQVLQTANFQVGKADTYLYIPTGANFKTVLDSLKQRKIIHETVSFAFLSKLLKYQSNVKSGRYLIRKNMSNLQAVRMLRAGLQAPVKLTFHNIRLKDDFTYKIAERLEFSKEDLDKLLNDENALRQYGFNPLTVMCMFLPDTYEVYWNVSPAKFLDRMYKNYQGFWDKKRLAKAKAIGMSPVEISILASIVQAETRKEDEKSRMAGAYINRLKEDMKLQADPTVVFAVGDFSLKRVLNKHIAIDSPYNTYKYLGLPPGPINLPTKKSIDAVLNYEKHDYRYFCVREDFSGYHNFASNYQEHLRYARLYQKALDERGIR